MEFYLVTAKCGHVGRTAYMPITFPVKAESGKEAAQKVKTFPRVKRHHWDAILSCVKVDLAEYLEQVLINDNDPYLHVTSKQEQKQFMDEIESRIVEDNHQNEINRLPRRSKKPNLRFQKAKYLGDSHSYRFDYAIC